MTGWDDVATRLVRACLSAAACVNKIFVIITQGARVIILPQISPYQGWVLLLFFAQICASDLFLVMIAKALQVMFQVPNFLLLLSFGSCAPFAYSVYKLWFFIPCPPLASVVSNLSLLFGLGVLFLLGFGSYPDNLWMTYCYVMTTWPWFVVASAVARQYVERNVKKNPFSPVRELPFLGVMSSFILVLTLMAAKNITLSDCIVLTCADPILTAVIASLVLGKSRRKMHFPSMKMYTMLAIGILAYCYGDTAGEGIGSDHMLFLLARLMVAIRSIWMKKIYARFHHTKQPKRPIENELLFHETHKPKKHRFKHFPEPILFTLDAIFDSGLRDTDFHAMGPLGTQDLYMLTESTYLLPISSFMTFIVESDTIESGVIPPANATNPEQAITAVETVFSEGLAGSLVNERVTSAGMIAVVCLVGMFCMAKAITPWAVSMSLFDHGSSMHSWKYQPIICVFPLLIFDILFLNDTLSKFQIITILIILAIYAAYRADIWNLFKRKMLLLMTQDLHYYQPAVLRQLQRRTLLEFLEKTSTDDYGFILLGTAIRHGGNIRELARDTSVTVWDPAPTATAAWKLAFSLVTKSLKRQKIARKLKRDQRESVEDFINKMVVDVIYKAVDAAEGHGSRLRLAGSLASVMGKKRALRRLKELAESRRLLRKKRQAGQLSNAPTALAAAGGVIRSVHDVVPGQGMAALQDASRRSSQVSSQAQSQMASQMASPVADASTTRSQGALAISLNQSMQGSSRNVGEGEDSPLLPGILGFEEKSSGSGSLRGAFATAEMLEDASSPYGSLVVAFGDSRYGQLGLPSDKKVAHNRIMPIEELRGVSPLQAEAAGVASFVVGGKGQLWSFGSNRSLELGLRKEVTQMNVPQRTKAIREQRVVQMAGSKSASGQAHTLALTYAGEVYTFGCSSCGALGQGPEVRQTAPLLLRMTSEVRIRKIAAGARHSLMISDEGKIFAMGDNTHGQLGFPKAKVKMELEPVPVKGPLEKVRVDTVAAGDDHSIVSTEEGDLYSWGSNANGQLGLGRLDDQETPQLIRELSGIGVSSIALGARHSLVVARKGKQVWAFGSNVQGQLGIGLNNSGSGMQLSSPALINTLSGHRDIEIVQVAAAACHSLALTRSGEVYSFGENSHGQLGFPPAGTGPSNSGQQQASQLQRRRAEIDAPYLHSEGVGRLWLPTRILSLGLYRVRSISTANMHSLALAE